MANHVARAVTKGRGSDDAEAVIAQELAKIVPGRVSTEVDARLSFDAEGSVAKARAIVEAYDRLGVGQDRILIKRASTWEGIRAAERLEREGVQCNLTLLFSMAQAKACADAGVLLISPFVGRITDWFGMSTGQTYTPETDPGVLSVRRIYEHYKAHGIETVVIGASFRNTGQIESLEGCDRLTISPDLMTKLAEDEGDLPRQLSPGQAQGRAEPVSEETFRWEMNEDAMATGKLAESNHNFHAHALKLGKIIRGLIWPPFDRTLRRLRFGQR